MKPILQPKFYLAFAILFGLLITLMVHWSHLGDPFQVEEDFRTLFWFKAYDDPSLFPNAPYDLFAVSQYNIFGESIPIEDSSPGYSLILYLGSRFLSVITVHKILPFFLIAISTYYAYQIGVLLKDQQAGLALALVYITLNLAASTEISIIGGLHRSFVCPILLALLAYLIQKRFLAAAVVLLLSGAIYMPIFPVAAMTYGLSTIKWGNQGSAPDPNRGGFSESLINIRAVGYLIIATLLVIVIVSPMLLDRLAPYIGPGSEPGPTTQLESNEPALHILEDPRFQTGGRRPLFYLFPLIGRGGIVSGSGGGDIIHIAGLTLISLTFWAVLGRKRTKLPPVGRHLFIACCIGWLLAWSAIYFLSSFLFYVPSRHTQTGFFLLLLIFVVLNFNSATKIIAHWLSTNLRAVLMWGLLPLMIVVSASLFIWPPTPDPSSSIRWINLRSIFLFLLSIIFLWGLRIAALRSKIETIVEKRPPTRLNHLVLILIFLITPLYVRGMTPDFLNPPAEERPYLDFFKSLPEEVLIGGDPCSLDNVQFFGHRQVLFSCERFQFLPNEAEVVTDTLSAYYAAEPAALLDYCARYGIDYFVVDPLRFEPQQLALHSYFFEPYNLPLKDEIAGRTEFALNDLDEFEIVYSDNLRAIISCAT